MIKNQDALQTRPLTAADLQQVVDIDTQITGRRRPLFFEKRLAAAQAEPGHFIYIGCDAEGTLQGYLLARVLEGEFGMSRPLAILDAMGVAGTSQGTGIGRRLLDELLQITRHKHIRAIQTQADWRRFTFLRFLSSAGFEIAPMLVLEREVRHLDTAASVDPVKPDQASVSGDRDYSDPSGDDADTLARESIYCRTLNAADLPHLIRIDRKATGFEHRGFYERKVNEVLNESGIRVSLVAEVKGEVAGFIMARVDFGEFDRTEPTAVLDSIAVDPACHRQGVGSALLSQLLANLASLRLETVRTMAMADRFDVLRFLMNNGFRPAQRLPLEYRIG